VVLEQHWPQNRLACYYFLESYDDKNNLSDVQMSVNSYIGITYDDKNNLGNEGMSELRYSVVQRKSNIPQQRSDE